MLMLSEFYKRALCWCNSSNDLCRFYAGGLFRSQRKMALGRNQSHLLFQSTESFQSTCTLGDWVERRGLLNCICMCNHAKCHNRHQIGYMAEMIINLTLSKLC